MPSWVELQQLWDLWKGRTPLPDGDYCQVAGMRIRRIIQEPKVKIADRKAVVMLHGFAANAYSFLEMQPAVTQHAVTHNLDLPGMGYSDRPHGDYSLEMYAEFLKNYLDQAAIEKCDFVGHSLGGAVLCEFAARYPERVHRLVLLAPLVNFRRLQSGYIGKALQAASTPWLGRSIMAFHGRWAAKVFLNNIMMEKDLIDHHMINGYYDPQRLEHTKRAFFELHKMLANPDYRNFASRLKEVAAPVLLMWGEADPLLPFEDAQFVLRNLTQAKLISYPDAGHMLMHERARDVNAAVCRYLFD